VVGEGVKAECQESLNAYTIQKKKKIIHFLRKPKLQILRS